MKPYINKEVRKSLHIEVHSKMRFKKLESTTQFWEVIYGADSACLNSLGRLLQSD